MIFRTPVFESFNIQDIVGNDVYIHMDRSYFILVFQVQRYECVGIFDTIYEVGTSLDHTLVDQFLEWFIFANDTHIIQEFIPETAVNQVTGSMFRTTYIQVYIAPVSVHILIDQSFIIVRIHITQVISG